MSHQKILEFKTLLQLALKQQSIKIGTDGKVQIIYRFKPMEFPVTKSVDNLQLNLLQKLEAITSIKFRITKLQKEPAFCYNTYVRVISVSSATSRDKLKHFLSYFKKQENGKFEKTSYCQIILNVVPTDKDCFKKFLDS